MNKENLLEKLFNEGQCLTYNWHLQGDAIHKIRKMSEQFKAENPYSICFIQNKAVPLPCMHHDFCYFSNGALVVRTPPMYAGETIKQARKILALNGFVVKDIYAPQNKDECQDYFKLFLDIQDKCKEQPLNDEDLVLRAFDSPAEFADYCFNGDNILLNASQDESFEPKYRQMLALFSNGLFVVDEQYEHSDSFHGDVEIRFFENRICEYPLMQEIYVPHVYLEALYQRAKQYKWYISSEDVTKKIPQVADAELAIIKKYAEDILENRTCISILTPRVPYNDIFLDPILLSPDYHRYVLFDDGKLVLSKKYYYDEVRQKHLLEDFKRSLPKMKFAVELVADECIDYLYQEIYKRQSSARDIYLQMMRQKAELIADIFGVPVILAQDAAAKYSGWRDWQDMQTITIVHARYLIAMQQDLNKRVKKNGYPNDVIYNGTAYFDLLKAQNIPYDNAQAVYQQLKANLAKAKRK
ncbi:MAG: hypothetical protein J6N45_08690 [Alphaproteobacteria bacterium]|nr:hypothetical protein [Alphaproteobacteria bacterium]